MQQAAVPLLPFSWSLDTATGSRPASATVESLTGGCAALFPKTFVSCSLLVLAGQLAHGLQQASAAAGGCSAAAIGIDHPPFHAAIAIAPRCAACQPAWHPARLSEHKLNGGCPRHLPPLLCSLLAQQSSMANNTGVNLAVWPDTFAMFQARGRHGLRGAWAAV